jgi:hypothetical protein
MLLTFFREIENSFGDKEKKKVINKEKTDSDNRNKIIN